MGGLALMADHLMPPNAMTDVEQETILKNLGFVSILNQHEMEMDSEPTSEPEHDDLRWPLDFRQYAKGILPSAGLL